MAARPTATSAGRSLARRLLSAALLLVTGSATAGGFHLSPVLAEAAPGQHVASFRLSNTSESRSSVQVEIAEWRQSPAGETRVPTAEVVVVPRILTLGPGQQRIVRLALRGERDRERAFRVAFRELPAAAAADFVGVRTLLHVDVPLFFSVARDAGDAEWSIIRGADGTLKLEARNAGRRYLQPAGLQLSDARGARIGRVAGPLYVLAGQTMRWPLADAANVAVGETVRIRYLAGGQTVERETRVVAD